MTNHRIAAFILNSPFQALCAIEAIKVYEVEESVFYILNDPNSREMIIKILDGSGEIRLVDHANSGTADAVKYLSGFKERFKRVFVGDYFSYVQYLIAVKFSRVSAQVIYLDDGNSTLEIAPPICRKRYENRNQQIAFFLVEVFAKLKFIKKSFFTLFNISESLNIPVIENKFATFNGASAVVKKGVYIIGTNTSIINLKNASFDFYFKEIVKYSHERFPDDPILYCPHRRDKNDYTELLGNLGVDYFNTDISVEVDFCSKGIYPNLVIGFGSTALLTLKKIFPATISASIVFESVEEAINMSFREIESYYSTNGVSQISF